MNSVTSSKRSTLATIASHTASNYQRFTESWSSAYRVANTSVRPARVNEITS
jgi:hypothetical protein